MGRAFFHSRDALVKSRIMNSIELQGLPLISQPSLSFPRSDSKITVIHDLINHFPPPNHRCRAVRSSESRVTEHTLAMGVQSKGST